jgi:hypothetical protein
MLTGSRIQFPPIRSLVVPMGTFTTKKRPEKGINSQGELGSPGDAPAGPECVLVKASCTSHYIALATGGNPEGVISKRMFSRRLLSIWWQARVFSAIPRTSVFHPRADWPPRPAGIHRLSPCLPRPRAPPHSLRQTGDLPSACATTSPGVLGEHISEASPQQDWNRANTLIPDRPFRNVLGRDSGIESPCAHWGCKVPSTPSPHMVAHRPLIGVRKSIYADQNPVRTWRDMLDV